MFLLDRFSKRDFCAELSKSRQKEIVDSNLFQDWGRIKDDGCFCMNFLSRGESLLIRGERRS